MPVEALGRWLREDVTYHHCHTSTEDLTRRVGAFEARLNRDPLVVADRLWVKDCLDPEKEKLRFSTSTRFRSERRLSSEGPSPVLLGGRQEFFQNRLDRNADRVQPSHKPARPDRARWVAHNARDAGRLDPVLLKRDLAREGQELDRGSFDPARLALGSHEGGVDQTAQTTPDQGAPEPEVPGRLLESFKQVLVRAQAHARHATSVDLENGGPGHGPSPPNRGKTASSASRDQRPA